MKQYLLSQFEILTLDGERILLPSSEQWFDLFHGALIEGQPLFASELARIDYELIKNIAVFKAGLRQLRKKGPWTPLFLFSNERLLNQRVHLEHLTCVQCKTKVWSANPLVYDLYIKTSSPKDVYERAKSLPHARCPVCGAALPRPSLFAFVKKE